jgi:hypothetical protein
MGKLQDSLKTYKDFGDKVTDPQLQPGWTTEADGFGLITSRCVFKWDSSECFTKFGKDKFVRGEAHPFHESGMSNYENLYLYKASWVADKTGIATVTAEYCGLDWEHMNHNEGLTYPQCSMVGSSASENIASHPNFIKLNCTSIKGPAVVSPQVPLAGAPNGTPIGDYNNSLWTPLTSGVTSYQQFVGFAPQQDKDLPINIKAGVKSYYKPQATIRMMFYVGGASENDNAQRALNFGSMVGWSTDGTRIGLPDPYKKLLSPTGSTAYEGVLHYTEQYEQRISRSFLITNVSCELFGIMYKVTMDLMLSGISGFDPDIYPKLEE